MPNFSKMNGGKTGNGTLNGTSIGTSKGISYVNTERYTERYTEQHVNCVPDTERHTEKTKSSTVPVQFQYDSHSAKDSNSFQDHHTLHTSNDSNVSKAGKSSTCKGTPSAKYFTEWTSSTRCTCPQATATGSETQRLISLEESPALAQWKDFCEQTPIEEARHSVTLFQLL